MDTVQVLSMVHERVITTYTELDYLCVALATGILVPFTKAGKYVFF